MASTLESARQPAERSLMVSRLGTALLVCACAAHALFAQAPQPTFRVQVEAIEIDASVTDASGRVVTDLTRDDFEVLENGKPQTITSFGLVNIPRVPVERPLFAANAIEPDVQSNNQGEGRLYVIALDQVKGQQILRTRRFVRRFLEQYFAPNDLGAVVFLGRADHSKAQGLTNNPRLLLQAVDSFTGGLSADPVPTGALPATQGGGGAPSISVRDAEADFELREAMSSFREITEYMATVHGRRKSLLLFSQGYPREIYRAMDYQGGVLSLPQEDMHRAITAATRNNVVIYPIDPRGLSEDGGLAESDTGPSTDPDARLGASFASLEARQSLTALAAATGGFALSNSNSFENAFDRIVQENSTYYVLGFSSTNERRDGRYRKLDVRVKRPGLVVRGRAGYMAPLRNERAPDPPKPSSTVSVAVAEALRSVVPVNGLPLRVAAAPFKSASREATIVMAVEVDASQLGLVEKDGTHVGALEVSYFSIDMKNKFFPGQTQTARLTLKPETYDQVMKTGIRMVIETALAPGRYQMRIAAGNREAKSGSVVYDLDVPDFTKAPLIMSGVSIGSVATSRIMTMNAKSPFAASLPGNITSTRVFDVGDTLGMYVEAYESLKDTTPHTVTLTAELRAEGGTAVRKVSEERSSKELQGKRGGYGFSAQLPLGDVAPGIYVIHLEARANVGDRPTVGKDIQIRVR
jgi:VWFA-related protein